MSHHHHSHFHLFIVSGAIAKSTSATPILHILSTMCSGDDGGGAV